MQILTISIDGKSRPHLVQALLQVMEAITAGHDSGNYLSDNLSHSFFIKEYELPRFSEQLQEGSKG
jgi:hypothetical protein